MKSVLYVAAALMIGASIYGFVDYNKTKDKKEFSTMYEEEATPDAVPNKKSTANEVTPVSKKEQVETVKEEKVKTENVNKGSGVKKSVNKIKKKKKLNYKIFSRAALEREEVILPAPAIKEEKQKEQ